MAVVGTMVFISQRVEMVISEHSELRKLVVLHGCVDKRWGSSPARLNV